MTTIDPGTPGETATAEDIAELNRAAIERSAAFARIAGAVLLVIGVVGLVAWLWLTLRLQIRLDDMSIGSDPFGGGESATSFADRVDALVGYTETLVIAALAVGGGLGLRALADYMVARTGGSLTGYRVGDDLSVVDDDIVVEAADGPEPP